VDDFCAARTANAAARPGFNFAPQFSRAFEVGVTTHRIEKTLEYTRLGPSAEPPELAVPVAESRRQVAPWRASPNRPENGFQKQTTTLCRRPGVADIPRQMRLNLCQTESVPT